MTKHTSGPWVVIPTGLAHPKNVVASGNRKPLVVARIPEMENEALTDANARLIAAAPEMYEALYAVWYGMLAGHHDKESPIRVKVANALVSAGYDF